MPYDIWDLCFSAFIAVFAAWAVIALRRASRSVVRSCSGRRLLALVLLCLVSTQQSLLGTAWAEHPEAARAVVRMPSHGASATVIHTEQGRTFLLSCAHAFEGADRRKAIYLDGEDAPTGTPTLLSVDDDLDLSLIEVKSGPVTQIAPAAGRGYRTSRNLLSVGYDNMRQTPTRARTTIVRETQDITTTREPPWHGRSGGALLDLETGQLVGVVSGYMRYPEGPGIYVSHSAICRFLERSHWTSGTKVPANPAEALPAFPSIPLYIQPRCPGGRCPLPGEG